LFKEQKKAPNKCIAIISLHRNSRITGARKQDIEYNDWNLAFYNLSLKAEALEQYFSN